MVCLMASLAARFIFMLAMPAQARSSDAYCWESVSDALAAGENPYHTMHMLSWAPFWLQVIFFISKISTLLAVPFFRVLQCFLILVESAVIVLLVKLIREAAPAARVRRLVIWGISLNPAAILLVCQHCNFDVIVALWLMFFMLSMFAYSRSGSQTDWLAACLFLGLGILTKTVPLVLFPMLAGGFRKATALAKILGLVLLLGPTTLGLSVIYVLSPADIVGKVLEYRSTGGFFGISGLFHIAGIDSLTPYYNLIFYILLAGLMAATGRLFWQRGSIGDQETVLLTVLTLVAIPTLGPGYAPQYLYWYLPLLVATYAFFDGRWRGILLFFAVVGVVTFVVEYAILSSDGYYFINILICRKVDPHPWLPFIHFVQKCDTLEGQTLLRLPLFIAYLVLLFNGSRLMVRTLKNLPDDSAGR